MSESANAALGSERRCAALATATCPHRRRTITRASTRRHDGDGRGDTNQTALAMPPNTHAPAPMLVARHAEISPPRLRRPLASRVTDHRRFELEAILLRAVVEAEMVDRVATRPWLLDR